MVDFDAYQLFGIRNPPAGTDWDLSTDYLSERGFGFGTDFEYDRHEFFGFVGPATGIIDLWAINDDGVDNLGLGRRDIVPEEDFRYRLFGQHRQRLESGWDVTAEVGLLSDRTFLEQYYEHEWDELKDQRTGVRAQAARQQSLAVARSQRPGQRLLHRNAVAAAARPLLARRVAARTTGSPGSSTRTLAYADSERGVDAHRTRRLRANSSTLPWEVDRSATGSPTANGSSRGMKSTCRSNSAP